MSELTQFRVQKDQFFKNHPQSPLTPAQRQQFQGLHYFPENPALRMILTVEEFIEKDVAAIQTTTGDVREYLRYGRFFLQVDGQDVVLTLYGDEGEYFLPFVDGLADVETYPAGRYLEPTALGQNQFLVDFNLAYNPYCAYNDAWSCPITPRENRTQVVIRAGEKIFADADH